MRESKKMIYNVMEEFVKEEVEHLMNQEDYKGCTCERCRSDIIAMALNKLPAKYVVTEQGEVICKVEATIPQNRVDILTAVAEAATMVQKSPRHKKD